MIKSGSMNTFDKNKYLTNINPTVLKMIHQKKYPLCQEKYLKMQKYKQRNHLTCSASHQSALPHNNAASRRVLKPNVNKKGHHEHRTIGDHLVYQKLRNELQPLRVSEQMSDVNDRLNIYIWQKKKEILRQYNSTERSNLQKDKLLSPSDDKQSQISSLGRQSEYLRRPFDDLPYLLKKITKEMRNQPINDVKDEQINHRKSDFLNKIVKLRSKNIVQDSKENLATKRLKREKAKQVEKSKEDGRLQRQMMKQLRDSEGSDRLCKMRIVLNHKKIVSMG